LVGADAAVTRRFFNPTDGLCLVQIF
jgi:hypothetical protein